MAANDSHGKLTARKELSENSSRIIDELYVLF